MTACVRPAEEALLPLLVCPMCGRPLSDAENGLRCLDHGVFPTRGGIPSFLSGDGSHFDVHWNSAVAAKRAPAKVIVAETFLKEIIEQGRKLAAYKCVIDVGCGDGVHIELLRSSLPDASIVGLDSSLSALRTAHASLGGWLPVHADAERLPFPDETFDVAFSYGVLAYLNDPWRGLSELARVTKPDGLIGVWFAPRKSGVLGRMFELVRRVVPHLPRGLQVLAADLIVPFLGLLPTASGLNLRSGTWRECREVVLVNIAPPQLMFPTRDEIINRMKAARCEPVQIGPDRPITIWGRKKAGDR